MTYQINNDSVPKWLRDTVRNTVEVAVAIFHQLKSAIDILSNTALVLKSLRADPCDALLAGGSNNEYSIRR